MKCPHLTKWVASSCTISEKIYFPSFFELREYCEKKTYKKCPFYVVVNRVESDELGVECLKS
jgi:hypothetical protein